MMDVVRKNGDHIDTKKLSDALGCPVVETSAVKGEGCMKAAEQAITVAKAGRGFSPKHTFDDSVEGALSEIESMMEGLVPAENSRWFAVKLFERDEKVLDSLSLAQNLKLRLEDIDVYKRQRLLRINGNSRIMVPPKSRRKRKREKG